MAVLDPAAGGPFLEPDLVARDEVQMGGVEFVELFRRDKPADERAQLLQVLLDAPANRSTGAEVASTSAAR